jgi:NAD(P)-dependent dehydrogenase (short-subunit alcohol dehydrogenase family)
MNPTIRRIVPVAVIGAAVAVIGAGLSQSGNQPIRPKEGSMQARVVLITGSTDGLGRELALRVGALGAHVIVHGRNRERGQAVVDTINREGSGSARFYAADFGALAEVRRFAGEILRDYPTLHVLVNNAGIWVNNGERQVSADGHELHFAVNYLSGFLLTRLLLPRLIESAPSRIVNVASGAQSPIDFEDVMLERPGRASHGYAQSKLAQILFTIDLAGELQGRDVTVAALHPATLMNTTMVRESGLPAQSTIDEGADAVMQLIVGTGVESGQYFEGLRRARAHRQAYDSLARERLRRLSLELTGLSQP